MDQCSTACTWFVERSERVKGGVPLLLEVRCHLPPIRVGQHVAIGIATERSATTRLTAARWLAKASNSAGLRLSVLPFRLPVTLPLAVIHLKAV